LFVKEISTKYSAVVLGSVRLHNNYFLGLTRREAELIPVIFFVRVIMQR